MNKLFLLLGSNLGDSQFLFRLVIELLNFREVKIISQSSFYKSPPWGFEHENDFFNQVLIAESILNANEILEICLQIEVVLGREQRKKEGYSARNIDIDLLFMNDEVIKTDSLVLPHPRLHLRKFTLLPLVELAPCFIHPIFNKTMQELLIDCEDNSEVYKS